MDIRPDETIADAIRRAATLLTLSGIDEPLRDSRLLAGAALGAGQATLIARETTRIGQDASSVFSRLVRRRMNREPVSRILGQHGFWKDELLIAPGVLDPRADTETLVEAVLDYVPERLLSTPAILDLGTGSGAILCALLREFPKAAALGIDVSPAACALARRNLERLKLTDRAEIREGGWEDFNEGKWNIIVSNPPYIESGEISALDPEVRLWDPATALDGGPDGLGAYRSLAPLVSNLLAPGGLVFLEVGFNQSETVPHILAMAGLLVKEVRRDLGGNPRVVIAAA